MKPSMPSLTRNDPKKMISPLSVASRGSPLAISQANEVLRELNFYHPFIQFAYTFVETTGDKDQVTSLRTLDKTDFFTKEIDDLLLSDTCRIAIHSAKDLPDPLANGLVIAALTRGLDPSDALVLKSGKNLSDLMGKALIATSSIRREEAVRKLLPDAEFTDIRGTINQRLQILGQGPIDGVVIAEAALIRLGLTHLNRVKLPGLTAPFQGQLAILIQKDDLAMQTLFSCIDSRQLKGC